VLVHGGASELGAEIDHLEVGTRPMKKRQSWENVFSDTINQAFPVSGNGLHQLTVEDIGGPPGYKILHTEVTNYTESSTYGVFVNTPANNSTQATLFPFSAFAVEATAEESSSGIDHIEVWNGNTKLGDSPKGTSISQWYSLAPGKVYADGARRNRRGQRIHGGQCQFHGVVQPGNVSSTRPPNDSNVVHDHGADQCLCL